MDGSEKNAAGHAPLDFGIGRLFYTIPDAIIVGDARGRIVLWNPAATQLFGWSEGDALGRDVRMLVPVEHMDAHVRGMARFATTGHGPLVDTGALVDVPARHKDGSALSIQLRLVGIERQGQRYALAIVRDVTAQRAAEATVERLSVARPLVKRLLREFVELGAVDRPALTLTGQRLVQGMGVHDLHGLLGAFREMGLGALDLREKRDDRFEFGGSDLIDQEPGARATTCYLTLGFLLGTVERVSGRKALGSEMACQSRGDERCLFSVRLR